MEPKNTLLWIDILGFGKEIEQGNLHDSIKDYDEIINNYIERYSGVGFDIISDSLLFWPKNTNGPWQEKSNIVQAAHSYSHTSLMHARKNSLIRGAIIFDEYLVDNRDHEHHYTVTINGTQQEQRVDRMKYHRILGKAIVKAHRWESTQEWCLVSIDPVYNNIIEDSTLFPEYLLEHNYLIKYPIPTKQGIQDGFVVNPFMKQYCLGIEKVSAGVNDSGVLPIIGEFVQVGKPYEECLGKHKEVNRNSESISKKIENTIKFYEFVCTNELYVKDSLSP